MEEISEERKGCRELKELYNFTCCTVCHNLGYLPCTVRIHGVIYDVCCNAWAATNCDSSFYQFA